MSQDSPDHDQNKHSDQEKRIIPIENLASAATGGSLFASAKAIHPRSTKGRYTNLRWLLVWITQIIFYGLPWLNWGERQAVLFELASRKFYIFGLVLYPQDFIYLTGILVISALSLFLFTAVAGRLWCGYACPQTVYTEIFLWVEAKLEGDRSARLRLDKSPWNGEKIAKRGGKHVIWLLIALWTGLTFVGYFSPIRELVCKYMCPYARFQSAMFDADTLIVTYDQERGEPRGARSKKMTEQQAAAMGDCIDCKMCVQVCPTGIDIRNGLQYECIGCGVCVDACDEVMDKVGYPRGLIKYYTQNAVNNRWTVSQVWERVRRPRVLVYTSILLAIAAGLVVSLTMRSSMRVDVIRDRGVMARMVDGGKIENVYTLRVMNTTEREQDYEVRVHGIPGALVASGSTFKVAPAQVTQQAVSVRIQHGSMEPGSHEIYFDVKEYVSGDTVSEKAAFFVPNR